LNTDLSVAPEIAQLAAPFVPAQPDASVRRTDGRIAGELADLAATPQRWWDLVRFDTGGPVRIPVPGLPGTWLLVLPPGKAADCDCQQATALAGEALELSTAASPTGAGPIGAGPIGAGPTGAARTTSGTAAGRPLRPGRVRVHGTPARHRIRAVGPGYSVTLHATVSLVRSE
jgi:hypothetical protein